MAIYVAPTITVDGIVVNNYQGILNFLLANYASIFGSTVYLGTDGADYQDIAVRALQASDVNSALQAVWLSFNLQFAIGTSLDLLGKLVGTARRQSSSSVATLTITGTPGTTILNGQAQDTVGNFWNLPSSITIPSGGATTAIATANKPGNITANPGTINLISTPTAGWTGVTNAAAATPGQAVEPDSSYRARLQISQAKPSLSLRAGTAAAVAAVPAVTRSFVYENPYGFTAGYGLVSTAGTAVTLILGYPFDSTDPTEPITINGKVFSIASVGGATSLALTAPYDGVASTASTTNLNPTISVASSLGIVVGQIAQGAGIPALTTVASLATVTTTGTASSGSVTLTVASATGIVVGQAVAGAGIEPGTSVTAIVSTTVTLSLPTTAPLVSTSVVFTTLNITLSSNCTATASGVSVQFYTPHASLNYFIGDGISLGPPHSITAVVEGGTSDNISQAIYNNKNPGVLTNGTTTVSVTDPNNGGISIPISFDVLGYVEIYVSLNIHPLAGFTSAVQAEIAANVLAYLDALGIGEPVIYSQLYYAAATAQPSPLQPVFSIFGLTSGFESAQTSAITVLGNPVITVTSATGIANGQVAVGAGIPDNTTVSSMSGTSITLSAPATASASAVPVTFYTTGTADIQCPYNEAPSSVVAAVVISLV